MYRRTGPEVFPHLAGDLSVQLAHAVTHCGEPEREECGTKFTVRIRWICSTETEKGVRRDTEFAVITAEVVVD